MWCIEGYIITYLGVLPEMHNLNLTAMKLYDKPKLMDILQNKGPVLFKTINVRKKEKKLKDCFRLKETKDMKTKMQ